MRNLFGIERLKKRRRIIRYATLAMIAAYLAFALVLEITQ